MVGLSVVLETSHSGCVVSPRKPKLNHDKTNVLIASTSRTPSSLAPTSFPPADFLEHCFLCRQRLLTGKDIYMYRGDRGFCSVECRSRQMIMDDEEDLCRKDMRSMATNKPSASSSTAAVGSGGVRKGHRKAAGGFTC